MGWKKQQGRVFLRGLKALAKFRQRTLRIEPLEQRTLLSVSSQLQFLDADLASYPAKDPGTKLDVDLYLAARRVDQAAGGNVDLGGLVVNQVGDMLVIDAFAQDDPTLLASELVSIGGTVTGAVGQLVSALVPLTALNDLGALPHLAFARTAAYQLSIGSTTTQGDLAQQSNILRDNFGLDGAGQTVGVLSDSFDALGGAAGDVASGDLPGPANPNGYTSPVNVLSDLASGTDEGRAMLQIVHDIAPAANLAFATASLGQASFAANIAALQSAGATVIVDDVIYLTEPMFMDGPVAQAVDAAVSDGVAYFASAGNQGRNSVEYTFADSGIDVSVPTGTGNIAERLHDFDPSAAVDVLQQITLPASYDFVAVLQWAEPFASVAPASGGAQTDLDLFVLDKTGSQILAASTTRNIGGDPVELLYFKNPNMDFDGDGNLDIQFNIAVGYWPGGAAPPTNPFFKIVFYDFNGTIDEFATGSGTIYGHANAAGASSVGAAFYYLTPQYGTSPPLLEPFSSAGGTPIYFDSAGNLLPGGPVYRQSPDIVAPDGVNTTFFGTPDPVGTGFFERDGFPNFFGTSAAAPHVAALAAQLRQAAPLASPTDIYAAMEQSCIDMQIPGYDYDSGWGLIDAAAAASVLGPQNFTFSATDGDDVIVLVRDSTGSMLELWCNGVLELSLPIQFVSHLTVKGLGGDDELTIDFTNGDPIPQDGVNYLGGPNGEAGDSLRLQGASVDSVEHVFTNGGSGQVRIGQSVVAYNELEPILDNLNVTNRVFTFTMPVADATVQRVSGALTRIDSGLSEAVDFTTPSATLTVNLADGSNQLSILSLADDYATPSNIINCGAGTDVVAFEVTDGSSAVGTQSWTVNGGLGDDQLLLTPSARNLDNLDDPIVFHGDDGSDEAVVNDSQNTGGAQFRLTEFAVDRAGWGDDADPGLTFDTQLEILSLLAGDGDDSLEALGVASGVMVAVDLGSGSNTVYAGTAAANFNTGTGSLQNIAGTLHVHGSSTTLLVDSMSDAVNRSWTVDTPGAGTGRILQDSMPGQILYDAATVGPVGLYAGSGDDQFTIDFAGGTAVDPLPAGGLNVFGGDETAGDSLIIENGSFLQVEQHFQDEHSGWVYIRDYMPGRGVIAYEQLEPITNNLNVAVLFFVFLSSAPDVTLTQSSVTPATHTRIDSSVSGPVEFVAPTSSMQIYLTSGPNRVDVLSFADQYTTHSNAIHGSSGNDVVYFETTDGNAGHGVAQYWIVEGMEGDDTLHLAAFSGNLDRLADLVAFSGREGSDTLFIHDENQTRGDEFTVGLYWVDRPLWGDDTNPGATFDSSLETLVLWTGGGSDTITVQGTSPNATTTVYSQEGDDRFLVDTGQVGGENLFYGGDGNDLFELQLTSSAGVSAPVKVYGEDNDFGSGLGLRDQVLITDTVSAARNPVFTYTGGAGGSEVIVSGIDQPIQVATAETIAYRGDSLRDDLLTVVGTADDDLLTVVPLAEDRALVFDNAPSDANGPFTAPPEDFFARVPGVSGGSARPDLDVSGLRIDGLTIDDPAGSADRLYIYGRSNRAVIDGNGFDPFGFGPGVIIPAFPNAQSYDFITVSDHETTVDGLVSILYDAEDFAQGSPQRDPAVVVNAGFEDNATVADQVWVTPSTTYRFQINGGDPDPATTGIVPPNGDQLYLPDLHEVDAYCLKDGSGNVTIEPDNGFMPVGYSSIENVHLWANVLNLIGDNNDPDVDQNDKFELYGRDVDGDSTDGGYREVFVVLNSLAWLSVDEVQFVNVFGDDLAGTPSVGPNDVDSLLVVPYADDTPRGWGIDIKFDEGNPILDANGGNDLLIYQAVPGVSETISVVPSGPGAGQLRVTNAATGSPVVVVDYMNNTGIAISANDGSDGDTDTLQLLGTDGSTPITSGDEAVIADFDATGSATDPIVRVSDAQISGPSGVLYQLVAISNVETVNFDLLDGNDELTLLGPMDSAYGTGVEQVNIAGGAGDDLLYIDLAGRDIGAALAVQYLAGTGIDQLVLDGAPAMEVANVSYSLGIDPGSGSVQLSDGTRPAMKIDFASLEPIVCSVPTGDLIVEANGVDNAIAYWPADLSGLARVSIDDHETIAFANAAELVLAGGSGDDAFSVTVGSIPARLTRIKVRGDDPSGGNSLLLNGSGQADVVAVTPTGLAAGQIAIGGVVPVDFADTGQLVFDGGGGGDQITVTGTAQDDLIAYQPAGQAGDARVAIGSLLEIQLRNLGTNYTVSADGLAGSDVLALYGTKTADAASLHFAGSDAGVVSLQTAGGQKYGISATQVESYRLDLLEGDDRLVVSGPLASSGEIWAFAEGPGASDILELQGTVDLQETVTVEPDPSQPNGAVVTGVGSPLHLLGFETVALDGNGYEDALNVRIGAAGYVRVQGGDQKQQLIAEGLPLVRFTQFNELRIDAQELLAATVEMLTNGLDTRTAYHIEAETHDVLVVSGAQSRANRFRITDPDATGPLVLRIVDLSTGVSMTAGAGGLAQLVVAGGYNDDELIVDVQDTDLVRIPVLFRGADGHDSLQLVGTPIVQVEETHYIVGPSADRVTIEQLIEINGVHVVAATIEGVGLEPVLDLIPSPVLLVEGDDADNAISYRAAADPTLGTVAIDNYEAITFANKATLRLLGHGGNDVISLHNQHVPTGLVGIEVDGGDPTASDSLIVDATSAADNIVVVPTGPESGQVDIAGLPGVAFAATEHVTIDGRGGGDQLQLETAVGDHSVTLSPSRAWDAGTLLVQHQLESLVEIAFEQLGDGGQLRLVDTADEDTFTYNGTSADNRFRVAGTEIDLDHRLAVTTSGIESYVLRGLEGVDTFDIVPLSGVDIFAEGGGPDSGDLLNYRRDQTGQPVIVVDLDATPTADMVRRVEQPGRGFVEIAGLETVVLDARDADLYISGTRADDTIRFVPLSDNSGQFEAQGVNTVFYFYGVPQDSRQVVITGGSAGTGGPVGGGFADQVVFEGTSGPDLIRVNAETRTIGIEPLGFGYPPTPVATWRSVFLDDGTSPYGHAGIIEAVKINGNHGDDTFHVAPALPIGNGLYVYVDGGAPTASDALVVTGLDLAGNPVPLGENDLVVLGRSRRSDAGNIIAYRSAIRLPAIGYEDVEVVSPNVASPDNLLVLGPDLYEQNQYRQTAADLGVVGSAVNAQHLAIFPNRDEHPGVPADEDWFVVTASETGILEASVRFRIFDETLLPHGGQLGIEVVDELGTVVAGNGVIGLDGVATGFGAYDGDPDARVRIPVVAGQRYYLHVFGQTSSEPFVADPIVVNGYDLSVSLEPVPVPFDLELADIVTYGVVTSVTSPSVFSGDSALANVDDYYNGKYLTFLLEGANGVLQAQRRQVADYIGATRTIVLDQPLAALPAVGMTFQIESFDTGRSQFDNLTRDNTPIFYIRLDDAGLLYDKPGNTTPDDPIDEPIRIPFNSDQSLETSRPGYRVAVFVEGEPQQPGAEPQKLIGFARALDFDGDGQPDGIYVFDFGADAIDPDNPNGPTTAYVLTDGSHFVSAKVQVVDVDDPDNNPLTPNNLSGFGERSRSLEIVVDTMAPPVTFGYPAVIDDPSTTSVNEADGLHPDSDTGTPGLPQTFADNITNDTTPTFWGMAEAGTLVRLYADADGNAELDPTVDHLLGQAVAEPLDGTNQFLLGRWEIASQIDLNDPSYFPALDGVRTLFVVGEDSSGNATDPARADRLQIFLDTRGPQVADPDGHGPLQAVHIADDPTTAFDESTYDLFDPKPSAALLPNRGPTPLVNALTIHLRDVASRIMQGPNLPEALLDWVYEATALAGNFDPSGDPGLFRVVGDANGVIPILRVEIQNEPLASAISGSVTAAVASGSFQGNGSLTDQDHYYEGMLLRFTGGPLAGQARVISRYEGNTHQFVFDTPFNGVPNPGDSFVIFPAAEATVTLVFRDPGPDGQFNTLDDIGAPLPDDRFTLTVADDILDPAGNNLDGESNWSEPHEQLRSPSGDGIPGEAFVARFTVDSRPEVAVWSAGSVYTDTNGNFYFDPTNQDYTNRDVTYVMGFATDDIFAGNFTDGRLADGFDKLGAYGRDTDGRPRWVIDVDNDGVAELKTYEPTPLPSGFSGVGHPVAGNFDGNADNGDEIGLFDGTSWWLDTNRNFIVSDEVPLQPGLQGYPVVGDFDGDGADDLATFLDGRFYFDLAAVGGLGNGVDASLLFSSEYLSFIGPRERPVAADLNQDGVDDLGLWVPDRGGQTPREVGEWYFLVSRPTLEYPQTNPAGSLAWLSHEFEPVPFGTDQFAQFGDEYAAPLLGNFDPPLALATYGDPSTAVISGSNADDLFEVWHLSNGELRIAVNNVEHYVGSRASHIVLDGADGTDRFIYYGCEAAEQVVAQPDAFVVTADELHVSGFVEQSVAYSGGGEDRAVLRDNADGFDRFYGTSSYSVMLYNGGQFAKAVGFASVTATSTGGNDVAKLYDTQTGDEHFEGTATWSQLSSSNYTVRAEGFRWTVGIASGGHDTARFTDRADQKDYFVAKPGYARLSGTEYVTYAKNFDEVVAESTGGNDAAYLYDDPAGDDTAFVALGMASIVTAQAKAEAIGFERISAFACGGYDTVQLEEVKPAALNLVAGPQKAILYTRSSYARALGFDSARVEVYGGDDVARLYDSPQGADVFEAGPTAGLLVGDGYRIATQGFRWLTAFSSGGVDLARLYDSSGNDIFVGRPDYSTLRMSTRCLTAREFDRVEAYSQAGGNDTAYLFDLALEQMPDVLTVGSDWAELSNQLAAYAVAVYQFETVEAYSSNQSDDVSGEDTNAVDWLVTYGWD